MKKILAMVTCIVLLFSMATPVFAAVEDSSSVLTASATQLKRGETFTVTATLTNSDTIGMGSVTLLLDESVF